MPPTWSPQKLKIVEEFLLEFARPTVIEDLLEVIGECIKEAITDDAPSKLDEAETIAATLLEVRTKLSHPTTSPRDPS